MISSPAPGKIQAPEGGAIPLVMVLGPTASGKTRLGVHLARRFAGEIVSFDSRQLFRGMNLGTGKDLTEFAATADLPAVRHHLIDIVDPGTAFDLHSFLPLAAAAIHDIQARRRLCIGVGGSSLYAHALLCGYRLEGGGVDADLRAQLATQSDAELLAQLQTIAPDVFARTDRTQRRRILRALEIALSRGEHPGTALAPVTALLLAPFHPRAELHRRIELRLDARLSQGLVDEVQALHNQGVSWERLEYFGLEYRWVARFLQGQLTFPEMRNTLLARIRQFCRSQEIWLRKMEREGWDIQWLPGGDPLAAETLVRDFLAGKPLPPPQLRLSQIHYGPLSGPSRHG